MSGSQTYGRQLLSSHNAVSATADEPWGELIRDLHAEDPNPFELAKLLTPLRHQADRPSLEIRPQLVVARTGRAADHSA